eukprot:COSAG05_NODE_15_length_36348_cov_78.369307_14_plen_147_part_00
MNAKAAGVGGSASDREAVAPQGGRNQQAPQTSRKRERASIEETRVARTETARPRRQAIKPLQFWTAAGASAATARTKAARLKLVGEGKVGSPVIAGGDDLSCDSSEDLDSDEYDLPDASEGEAEDEEEAPRRGESRGHKRRQLLDD